MEQFNINAVIDKYRLNTEELAKVLFPNVKYPKLAFDRVLRGEANLDTTQLQNLASYAGVIVTDLFAADAWKSFTEDGCMTFERGKYKAKINYKGSYLTLYCENKLIKQIIPDSSHLTVEAFITMLNNLIKNYENGTY